MINISNQTTPEILMELNKSVHEWHTKNYPDIFRDNSEGLLQYFKSSLERNDCFHFVAYDDAVPIGFIQSEIKSHPGNAFRHPQKLLYVNIVVVSPEYKGKGVGRMLFDKVVELAKSLSIIRIELDHWDGNEAAKVFSKIGFKPYRHYLGLDLI